MNLSSFVRGLTLLAVSSFVACAPQAEAPPPAPTAEPTPATITVSMSTELDAAPGDVWKAVSDFGGLGEFVEIIESIDVEGEGVGAVRTIHLPEGAKAIETLDAWDAEAMSFSYTMSEGPLPIEGYAATMTVSKLEEGRSKVDWSSTFKAMGASDADARKAVTDIYEMGFAGLEKLFPDTAAKDEETSE